MESDSTADRRPNLSQRRNQEPREKAANQDTRFLQRYGIQCPSARGGNSSQEEIPNGKSTRALQETEKCGSFRQALRVRAYPSRQENSRPDEIRHQQRRGRNARRRKRRSSGRHAAFRFNG